MAPPESGNEEEALSTTNEMEKITSGGKAITSSEENETYQHPMWYAKHNVHEKSLEDQSNIFTRWTLGYLSPLLRLGGTKVLERQDIGAPSDEDRASTAFNATRESWREEVKKAARINETKRAAYEKKLQNMSQEQRIKAAPFVKTDPGLHTALRKTFGGLKVAAAILFYILSALLQFLPVMILEDLVRYFETLGTEQETKPLFNPWVEVSALAVLPFLTSLLQTRSQAIFIHFAIYVRTAISTILYEKSLTVSAAGRACTNTGQVVNMMSNDTTQLQRFLQFGGMVIVAPLQIVLSLVLIYRQVGQATWVGVAFMVSLAPINGVVFSTVGKMRRKVLKYSDLRVKMMNEILNGIRIIKFYAWEKPFKKEVGGLRDKELKALTNLAYTSAIGFSLILLSAPIIQPILVFLTYIRIQDEPLTASTAFTTVALFNIMRFPFAFLPMGLLQFIQSRISLRRLQAYLQLPELDDYVVHAPHPDDQPGSSTKVGSVVMKKCSFSWTNKKANLKPIDDGASKKKKKERRGSNSSSSSASVSRHSRYSNLSGSENVEDSGIDVETLSDMSVTIEPGDLVAVVGTVGCGKSSFLSAILGEMEPMNDSKIYVPCEDKSRKSKMSYCCQSPWVVNDTLRGNVLFGREFEKDRYDAIIEACALLDDLAILPAGDKTEIGERGINLSGGQKARVSLARALYAKNTNIVLLDDPLSAVDAHVGEHLFKYAIEGGLMGNATRILVTHHVHFLPRCDKVIVLEGGQIKHYGKYSELIEAGVDFAGAVEFEGEEVQKGEDVTEEVMKADDNEPESNEVTGDVTKESTEKVLDENDKKLQKSGENLTTKEEREEGSVDSGAYFHYAKSGGVITFLSLFFVQGLGRASEIGSAFWLAYWAKESVGAIVDGDPMSDQETTFYLNIYAALGMAGVLSLTVRSILMAVHRLNASRLLHDNLTNSILRAPVSFFDVTPTGRVLNRFAADMDKVDLDLTQSIGQGMSTTFSVLGAIGAIVTATKGTFLIPLIPIGYIYWIIQKWFRKTSTELQRVTSVSGSPIFSDFSQVLSGTSTIRAFSEQGRFFRQCQNSFDNFNSSYNLTYMCNYWLGLRLDFLGGLIGFFIGAVAVGTAEMNFIPAGWLGLALSYSIEVTGFLKHGVRMIATIEADMNSVERILYYSENVDPELPDFVPEMDPPTGTWPSDGKIEVTDGSMRYRDGPLVLKSISVDIRGGEKVGVVGRTGSGKSSLMNVLFRITELEKDGGVVKIDGVDISQIGTNALRSNISIIPQDPVMFSNSVRYNIDPFGSSTDDEIWEVLEKVQLEELISLLPNGLEEEVAEGGSNFSQGQRQLLCIARSLLRKPKVLVMDEATASIDNTTDAMIQTMIRENFSDATVLTIAHRLNTILDSDRVLVLDDGKVAEFDTPKNLIADSGSMFKAMVDKSRAATS